MLTTKIFMINYTFNICECDAENLQAPQEPFEHEDDFLARLKAAEGKHFYRVIVQDAEQKQFTMESPYFDKTSDEQRFRTFDQGIKMVKKAMVMRERAKKKEQLQRN